MSTVQEWWSAGEHVQLTLSGQEREIFVRRLGQGPAMTLLHGFPSSSHDWFKLAPTLAERYSLCMPDFLGFGASEKPVEHDYTLHEQADLVEALWRRDGVGATVILAHDYAVSVAEELLARRAEGSLGVEVLAVHLLNGGLYPDLHRPQAGQLALLDPEQGPQVSALLNEELFTAGLRQSFAESFDASADCAEIWQAMHRDSGERIAHLLIRYLRDRATHAERWVGALEDSDVPLSFSWGMLDPISGAHMAERIRERLPDAPFQALEDVGHWTPLEAPERVAAAVLAI